MDETLWRIARSFSRIFYLQKRETANESRCESKKKHSLLSPRLSAGATVKRRNCRDSQNSSRVWRLTSLVPMLCAASTGKCRPAACGFRRDEKFAYADRTKVREPSLG